MQGRAATTGTPGPMPNPTEGPSDDPRDQRALGKRKGSGDILAEKAQKMKFSILSKFTWIDGRTRGCVGITSGLPLCVYGRRDRHLDSSAFTAISATALYSRFVGKHRNSCEK
ncbi:hypothetical protein EVAR_38073_1 [Eumeta japonica]|uniref:Uncharacterized protein n=1 Tax=Eumeta variegata TaxID=151549 RepID=A0A4C1W7G7_EUMVA|nr:hypothetical protein EVAR_38073_1 [Eumeta japonica]